MSGRFDPLRSGGSTEAGPAGAFGPEASESVKAMSLADWNRSSRSFSRQCRTMWSSAGETAPPAPESSAGSSLRIAAIVSFAVGRVNARLPESIS